MHSCATVVVYSSKHQNRISFSVKKSEPLWAIGREITKSWVWNQHIKAWLIANFEQRCLNILTWWCDFMMVWRKLHFSICPRADENIEDTTVIRGNVSLNEYLSFFYEQMCNLLYFDLCLSSMRQETHTQHSEAVQRGRSYIQYLKPLLYQKPDSQT